MEITTEALCSESLMALADHLPLGVLLIDAEFKVQLWNRTLERWTGQQREEIEQHALFDLFPGVGQEWIRERFESVLATGESFEIPADREPHFIPAGAAISGGKELMVQRVSVSRLADSVPLLLIVIEDMSRESIAQIQSTQLDTAEFISGFSHELRKPLDTIFGYTDFLSEQETAPERRAAFEGIRRNGERAVTVINDALDFAKIESGELRIDRTSFELKPLLRDIVSLIRLNSAEQGIEFNYSFEENAPKSIVSDPIRLRQILLNLLSNAVAFTDEGRVKFTVHRAPGGDGMVRFQVADSGVGIAPERMRQLFDPFRQADAKMSPRKKGTGLGLAISERLSRLLGGQLTVESELGTGSTFTLALPV